MCKVICLTKNTLIKEALQENYETKVYVEKIKKPKKLSYKHLLISDSKAGAITQFLLTGALTPSFFKIL